MVVPGIFPSPLSWAARITTCKPIVLPAILMKSSMIFFWWRLRYLIHMSFSWIYKCRIKNIPVLGVRMRTFQVPLVCHNSELLEHRWWQGIVPRTDKLCPCPHGPEVRGVTVLLVILSNFFFEQFLSDIKRREFALESCSIQRLIILTVFDHVYSDNAWTRRDFRTSLYDFFLVLPILVILQEPQVICTNSL